MKTINFCGDSFCRLEPKVGNRGLSWTTLLADKLNASILGWGKPAAAYEHAIQTFDNTTDYTIFCWTDPNRLYVNPEYSVNMIHLHHLIHQLGGLSNNKEKAAYAYFKYLHSISVTKQRYMRELYWFDHAILSNYKGVAIHLPCFNVQHVFIHGINIDIPLDDMRSRDVKNELHNHLTEQENSGLADKIYSIIKEHHEKTNT